MMGGIWFTCCKPEDAGLLAREIRARDERARILRVGDASTAGRIAGAFPQDEANAAIVARSDDAAALEDSVGRLARTGRAGEILVFLDRVDPASAARLFYAGATEVIAADGAACDSEYEVAREGRGPECEMHLEPPADDDSAGGPREGLRGRFEERTGEAARAAEDGDRGSSGLSDGAASESPSAESRGPMRRAPLLTVVSGRGGAGKTVLAASLATLASDWGMRAALVDLDLMFGDAHALLGVDEPADLGVLQARGCEFEHLVEKSAMRIAPGLTLWGPPAEPERAELLSASVERLLDVLRGVADIVIVDTSTYWSDAVAAAVAGCERCLVVGGATLDAGRSCSRAVDLVAKMGVARTRLMGVYNRFGAAGCGEDAAMRYEMAVSLSSRARIADGGDEVVSVASHAHLSELLRGEGGFARSCRELATRLFRELGCVFDAPGLGDGVQAVRERPRIRLPWRKEGGA